MRKVFIIGIGAGNPDHLTVQAINALNRADVVFMPDKGAEKADLRQLRMDICQRFIENRAYRIVDMKVPRRARQFTDYQSNVAEWHTEIEATYADLLTKELQDGQRGAFMVWGDPSLYDSTARIIETIAGKGLALEYEVIPGITSVQALAAKHRITLNHVGEPVVLTTGRKLTESLGESRCNVVVLLDGDQAFSRLDGADFDIYWGACLGTADEAVIAGRLADVADAIKVARERIKRKKGWVMDTYLLSRAKIA